MIRRLRLASVSLTLVFVAGAAGASHRQIPVVRIEVEQSIAAPPGVIWGHLTQGKNFVAWCPMWKSAANARTDLAKVGDVLDFTDQWGNGGRSIVTYFVKDKELRMTHEPNDGSYMCQARLMLVPAGPVTKVMYVDQYTDESKPEDLEATATKMNAEMATELTALKKSCEGK
jgi:hypothetical protein